MKSSNSGVQGQTTLGASLLAFTLSLTGSASPANASRTDDHLGALIARDAMRAERREQRLERRELRNQQDLVARPTILDQSRSNDRVNSAHFARHNSARQINQLSQLDGTPSRRSANTAQLPGQVSTFRTSRPNPGRSTFETDRGNSKLINRGIALDLSSTNANITIGENVLDGTVTLIIGGEEKQFSAGSRVTAAEYAALTEKLATGSQSLTLSGSGVAEGGSLNLNLVSDNGLTIRASELVVPTNVTVSGDFGRAADGVRVTKDLVNYGSIVATSSNIDRNTAVIAARDIENAEGGSIASVSSASNPNLNLALRADRDLDNAGSIHSAGDLELTAGRSITNSSGAVAGAAGNVVLNSSVINNQGTVSAQGDITLAGAADATLGVNNFGGTLSAVNGNINLRESGFDGTGNSIIYGGDLLSKQLNINAGQATGDVIARNVTGVINSSGLAAHVRVDTDTLVLGTQCLTGDPTYYNTGDIIIGGNITVSEDLTIIAGGNISDISGTPITLTARNGNAGQDITIIAGADITSGTGELTPPGGPATLTTGAQQALSAVTVSGPASFGGSITFNNANQIDSSSTGGNASGGNITLIAYANGYTGPASQGKINAPTTTLLASGNGSGNNGNVTVIGEQTVSIGQVTTNGGTGTAPGTGTVTVASRQPTTSDGLPITFGTNGSITSGNAYIPGGDYGFLNLDATLSVGSINAATNVSILGAYDATLGNIIVAAGDINISTTTFGQVYFSNSGTYSADTINIFSTGYSDIRGNVTADFVQVKTTNSINLENLTLNAPSVVLLSEHETAFVNATVNVTQGFLSVSGQQVNGNATPGTINGSNSGNGANIVVIAGASWTDNGNDVTINGYSGLGGAIYENAIGSLSTSSTGGGSAGNITMAAYGNGSTNSGVIRLTFLSEITAKGAGGSNGNVSIVANGDFFGNGIEVIGIDATGGTGGGIITLSSSTPNAAGIGAISKVDATYSGSLVGTVQGTGGIFAAGQIRAQQSVTVDAGTNGVNINSISVNGLTGNQAAGSVAVTGGGVALGAVQANGIGSGIGGTIDILANNLNASTFSANGGSSGAGGEISITGNSLSYTSLVANGGTTGTGGAGGSVIVSANSASLYSVGTISANGGGSAGNAGSISVTNSGDGGISFNPANISLVTNANGGNLTIDATVGAVDGPVLITGVASLSVSGNSGFDNGQIRIRGSAISRTSALTISAINGADHSGLIELTATSGDIAVSGNFSVATGGSIDINMSPSQAITTSNTGGSVLLQAVDDLLASGANIVTAGAAGIPSGSITISGGGSNVAIGNLTSVGTGSLGGGNINLTSVGGLFNVGDIDADGGTSGAGGSVTFNISGANAFFASISAQGFGGANGGNIYLTSAGNNINFVPNSSLIVDSSTGAAGSIQILTLGGDVVFQGGTNVLSAKGATSNGSISLSQLGTLSLGSANLTLDSNGTGADSNISVSFATSGSITASNGNLNMAASGDVSFAGIIDINTDGGDVSITANSTSSNGVSQAVPDIDTDVVVGVSGDVSIFVSSSLTLNNINANDITISTPTLTTLTMNSSITADGTTSISTGQLVQSGGVTINSDALQLNFLTSGITSTFSTNVNSLTATGVNNNIAMTEADDLNVLGVSNIFNVNLSAGGGVFVNAAQNTINDYSITAVGAVAINAPVTVVNSMSLTSSSDNVQIDDALTVSGASGSISLQATTGFITELANGAIDTGSGGALNITIAASPAEANLSSGTNNIAVLNGAGGGQIYVDNGANALSILNLGSTQSLNATTSSATGISLSGSVNTSGEVTLYTTRFSAGANNLSAARITVQSGTDLTLDSSGAVLTATTPAAGAPGSPSTPTAINFITGTGEDLTLNGTMTMNGDVTFSNVGGTTTSQNNSLYAGTNNVVLKTADWIQQGNGNITGNILLSGGVSIVNPDGDLVLAGNITFVGQDLVLAAKNNVVLGSFNINLSNTTDSGNDLTIIAGYTLTPTGGGQQQSSLPFTVGAPTAGGGSVTGTGSITTGSTGIGGNGGNVTVVATETGTISLGNIDTSASDGDGGKVLLIGAGVTVNNITTTGGTNPGSVEIRGFGSEVQLDSPPTPMVIQNGKITGGTFIPAATAPGAIAVNNIDAGNGSVTLVNLFSTVTVGNVIEANSVEINTDALTFTNANGFSVNPDASGNGGTIKWFLNTLNTPAGTPFALNADGSGTGNGGSVEVYMVGATPVFVGTPTKPPKGAANLLTLSAESGALGGNGGSLLLFVSGNLTVDTDFISASPQSTSGNWNGASYQLASASASGKTTLQVTGDLNAEGVGTGNGGLIALQSSNKKAFTANATKAPKNGNFGELNPGSNGAVAIINTGGGVNVASEFTSAPNILTLSAALKGSITTGKGVSLVAGSVLVLDSDTGAIGKKPLTVSAPSLAIQSQGLVNLSSIYAGTVTTVLPVSAGKALNLTAMDDVIVSTPMTALGDVNISSTGAISINDTVTTQSGSIALTAGSGTLAINNNLTANNGGIVLANLDTAAGSIDIGAVTIATAGKGDDVVIAIGAPPKKPTNTQAEPGFIVDNHGTKGVAYFGPVGGVVRTGITDVSVNVINKDVIFNNLSTGGQSITVEGGAVITADPPSRTGAGLDAARLSGRIPNSADVATLGVVDAPTNLAYLNLPNVFDPSSPTNASVTLVDTMPLMSSSPTSIDTMPSMNASTSLVGATSSMNAPATINTVGLMNASSTTQPGIGADGSSRRTTKTVSWSDAPDADLFVDADFHHGSFAGAQEIGNVIFAPRSDMTFETKHGTVSLKAGSVALVMQSERSLSVYDLHDQCKNAVTVRSGTTHMSLTPGRHATISSQSQAEFVDVNPIELVQHRGLNQSKLNNGFAAFTSEFSIPSACYAVKPLAKLMNSNKPDARKLAQQLIKTTSVILTLNPDRGDYVQFFKPRVSAMR